MRMRDTWLRLQRVGPSLIRGVASEIGRDELFLAGGLGLLGYGLWLTPWPPAAFIIPGLVLVWMALPPRKPFVVHAATKEERRA